jgi:hypothetical protein
MDKGRKSEIEATAAVSPIAGELSPPDTPNKAESEVEGRSPEDTPVADNASAAPAVSSAAIETAAQQSGTAATSSEASATQRAIGQPGIRDHESTAPPKTPRSPPTSSPSPS